MNKELAKQNLKKLIERFKKEFESGKTNAYTEEDTKKSFIEPLLSDVLGWDTRSRDEVTMEERVSRDRVDYGIKLDGKIRFFVEAKPVKADLEKAIPQAVKYCYNRKDVPFVMLTDFEGLMFFDATFKPDTRHAKKGLKINLKWDEYVDKFDELWQISRPAVMEGSLEKLFTLKPKDREPVDKAILTDLEDWREALAKNLYKLNLDKFHSDNRDSDAHFLKEITQKILDRVIFIRFCEDRQLIQIRPLKPRFDERGENTGDITYTYILSGIFKEYENVFNSDLFKRQDWEADLKIDFKILNEIVQETYDPYMFDAIPLEVLGNIYEQYLGYTIKLAGDSIKYELKPEVRKAGGVYYTPEYIVDYIVKNTVGKLLAELPEAKAKKLRILDPACGSGSFLIRAYEEMLKYYLDLKKKGTAGKVAKREEKDKQSGQVSIETEGHEEKLTVAEKAMILKEHIYGVDIDDQAVEVTKLSLMLKMLEGEWGFVKGTAVLPMLDKNIKCGNSLISGNVLELSRYFGNDFHKVKPFNWEEQFLPIVVNEKGFDVVIGNPPYGATFTNEEKKFLGEKYKSTNKNNNSYIAFYEKGINELKDKGLISLLTPTTFLTGDNFLEIREIMLINNIKNIVKLPYNIFEDAYIDTCVSIIKKELFDKDVLIANIPPKEKILTSDDIENKMKKNSKNDWLKNEGKRFLIDDDITKIVKKILSNKTTKLSEIFQVDRGTLPPKNYSSARIDNNETFHWFNGQIYRYDYQKLLDEKVDCKKLKEFKTNEMFKGERILLRQLISRQFRINAMIVKDNFAFKKNLYCIYHNKSDLDLRYFLAIINSKLFSYYIYNSIAGMQKNDFPSLSLNDARNIPIYEIDKKESKELSIYNSIISLVDIMIDLKTKITSNKNSSTDQIQIQFDKTDKEIDNFIYELYNITLDEKVIIDNHFNSLAKTKEE
jgi:type I restriction-modification system DNA methylase subunit